MQNVDYMNAIRLLEHENSVDVLKHDFVVMSLAVELCEVGVKVK